MFFNFQGTTVFCASYYIICECADVFGFKTLTPHFLISDMLMALSFTQTREMLAAVTVLNIVCLSAIAGVFCKKPIWLVPLFVLFVSNSIFVSFD